MRAHMRVVRPTNYFDEIVKFYKDGLGFSVLSFFENQDGFDGIMLGHPQMDYHLEFSRQKGKQVPPAPSLDNLLVFYIADKLEWRKAIERMNSLGYEAVKSHNPYWEKKGRTFEDADKYRVVLYNGVWK